MAMPFEWDEETTARHQVDARPSAVLELTWLLHSPMKAHLPPRLYAEALSDLRDEASALFDDGISSHVETSVLAARIDALLTDEADAFISGLEEAAQIGDGGLELRSESAEVRAATLARLERLRREPQLRRRYAAVLGRVWALVRDEWEAAGRDVVRQTCAAWTERIRQGATAAEIMGGQHIATKPAFRQVLEQRPRHVLSPLYFTETGGFIIDMTAYLHMGGAARPMDADELLRRESETVANRLKILADGTRLGLLLQIAREPSSVMDLARRFGLAQPTVSNHIRLLRDAGLLIADRDGTRVVYRASIDRIDDLLSQARHVLVEHNTC